MISYAGQCRVAVHRFNSCETNHKVYYLECLKMQGRHTPELESFFPVRSETKKNTILSRTGDPGKAIRLDTINSIL